MLNLLIFSPFAVENGRGGEISSMELAAGLNKYYKVIFIDTNQFIGEKLLSDRAIKNKLNGVNRSPKVRYATINIFNRLFTIPYPLELRRLYKEVKKNDIIYFSYNDIKHGLFFMFCSLIHRKARFIVGYRKPLYSNKIISLYNLKYRFSILFFSLFKKRFYHHTLSHQTEIYLENFYNSDKIIHIIHGIDLESYKDNGMEKKDGMILNFIYVGYLDDVHKGIGVLLDGLDLLLADYNNLKIFFDFYGIGPFETKLKKLQLKYSKFIKFHGYVSNEKIPAFYKKADIFLFSSRREPFPRVIMEALAANCIIQCTKTIGSFELLKGQEFAFFLPELSPKAIKEKILEIYKLWEGNPEKFRELQMSAKEYVFSNYSFTRELEMFKDLIDKIGKTNKKI